MLLYHHLVNHARLAKDDCLSADLKHLPVYEISNVLDLFDDWESQYHSSVPKRPPHDKLWVEWKRTFPSLFYGKPITHTYGCVITMLPTQQAKDKWPLIPRETETVFDCLPFMRTHNKESGIAPGTLAVCNTAVLMNLLPGGAVAKMVAVKSNVLYDSINLAGLYEDNNEWWMRTWPAFMAFSLLHCKNVSTEEIKPEPLSARLQRQGHPPSKSYKVLRLQLPSTLRPHGITDSEEAERHVRFHLCRGHFKNLQHERYKAQGWHWWPAHWRGDPGLGRVDKHYELIG